MRECNNIVSLLRRYKGTFTKIRNITAKKSDQSSADYKAQKVTRAGTVEEQSMKYPKDGSKPPGSAAST